MKLVCDRKLFATAFLAVSGIVPSRTVKEILKNIKLEVTEGHVTLIGSDGEIGMRCVVPDVTADTDGSALLPTARIVQILRELNAAQGFPSTYIFRGNKADVTKQIGNSVSPSVAEAITRTLAG